MCTINNSQFGGLHIDQVTVMQEVQGKKAFPSINKRPPYV